MVQGFVDCASDQYGNAMTASKAMATAPRHDKLPETFDDRIIFNLFSNEATLLAPMAMTELELRLSIVLKVARAIRVLATALWMGGDCQCIAGHLSGFTQLSPHVPEQGFHHQSMLAPSSNQVIQ